MTMAISTGQIAEQFTALCKQGKLDEAGERYWADNVVSLEPIDGEMARVKGRDARNGIRRMISTK
jgi:hypothetical protein